MCRVALGGRLDGVDGDGVGEFGVGIKSLFWEIVNSILQHIVMVKWKWKVVMAVDRM